MSFLSASDRNYSNTPIIYLCLLLEYTCYIPMSITRIHLLYTYVYFSNTPIIYLLYTYYIPIIHLLYTYVYWFLVSYDVFTARFRLPTLNKGGRSHKLPFPRGACMITNRQSPNDTPWEILSQRFSRTISAPALASVLSWR